MKRIILLFLAIACASWILISCKSAAPQEPAANTPTITGTAVVVPTSTVTNTAVSTFTSTPTCTPTSTQVLLIDHHLNSGLEGWYLDGTLYSASTLTHNVLSPYGAKGTTGCAKMTCTFTGTTGSGTAMLGIVYDFPNVVNKQNADFTINLYIPADLAAMSTKYNYWVAVKTASNPTVWQGKATNPLSGAGWNAYTVSGSSFGSDCTDIIGVTVQIYKATGSADWAGDIYFDEVYW